MTHSFLVAVFCTFKESQTKYWVVWAAGSNKIQSDNYYVCPEDYVFTCVCLLVELLDRQQNYAKPTEQIPTKLG